MGLTAITDVSWCSIIWLFSFTISVGQWCKQRRDLSDHAISAV